MSPRGVAGPGDLRELVTARLVTQSGSSRPAWSCAALHAATRERNGGRTARPGSGTVAGLRGQRAEVELSGTVWQGWGMAWSGSVAAGEDEQRDADRRIKIRTTQDKDKRG